MHTDISIPVYFISIYFENHELILVPLVLIWYNRVTSGFLLFYSCNSFLIHGEASDSCYFQYILWSVSLYVANLELPLLPPSGTLQGHPLDPACSLTLCAGPPSVGWPRHPSQTLTSTLCCHPLSRHSSHAGLALTFHSGTMALSQTSCTDG